MSHFILPTLNAFLYCVLFMVVIVSCGIAYALFKYFCTEEEEEQTTDTNRSRMYQNEPDNYQNNGFTPVNNHDDDAAPRYEHIPMMPTPKRPSPRASPIPSSPYPPTGPYPATAPYPSSSVNPPYPTSNFSATPYPTGDTGMPMPRPTTSRPTTPRNYPPTTAPASDEPPSYDDAMVQPSYNPHYKGN